MQLLTPITIIIATYNRSNVLKENLNSLITYYHKILVATKSEILIVDNNSTDDTYSIVQAVAVNFPFIKYFQEPNQGLSHGRNRGIKEAANEILIFLDDDVEVTLGWLEGLITPLLSSSKVAIVGGRVLPYKQPIPDWIPYKYYWLVGIIDFGEKLKYVSYAAGGNMAICKAIFDEIGLFDTELGRNGDKLLGGEEVDIQKRIINRGYKILYNPEALIHHKIASKLNENYVLRFAYLDGLSNKRMDAKNAPIRYLFKKTYGIAFLYVLIPIITLYACQIEISIRKEYFKGYIASNQSDN